MKYISFFKKNATNSILLAFVLFPLFSDGIQYKQQYYIDWKKANDYKFGSKSYTGFVFFDDAQYHSKQYGALPLFTKLLPVEAFKINSIRLNNIQTDALLSNEDYQEKDKVKELNDFVVQASIVYIKKTPQISLVILPIKYASGIAERLTSFEVVIDYELLGYNTSTSILKKPYVTNSVLSSGNWYKVGLTKNGVYKLDFTFFQKVLGIEPSGIDPRRIKIYGNGAGMLPQKNSINRPDDLTENAIQVIGEQDGIFNANDYVLFYGQSQQDFWQYDTAGKMFYRVGNIYSDTTYYFITVEGAMGKRVMQAASGLSPNVQTNEFDNLYYYEQDLKNLIKSGRLWVGEDFDKLLNRNYTVSLGNINTAKPIVFRSSALARSFANSNMMVGVENNLSAINHFFQKVYPSFESTYAEFGPAEAIVKSLNVSAGNFNVSYTYSPNLSGSIAWLNFFEINSRNYLSFNGNQFQFRDATTSLPGNITRFNFGSTNNMNVWDVTNKLSPLMMNVDNGSNGGFVSPTDSIKEFVAFGSQFYSPTFFGKIANQNLHALSAIDYVVVSSPRFIADAYRLAEYHRVKDNLRVLVVTPQEIYNEFSSGAQDICAIRDFMRMLYKKANVAADLPKYLLFVGRASYDYKYRISNNTNLAPTYESIESLDPVASYCSDDFFGLLDDNEGNWDSPLDYFKTDFLDIGIGRLPAQDASHATAMVDKIIAYDSPSGFGDWKNRIVFIADDGDGDTHINQAENMALTARANFKNYNIDKIYFDAYQQIIEAGGQRYPDVQKAINRAVERGALIVNYTGHGGEVGWADERVLNTTDVNSWTNGSKLPLFVTATCEFSRFEDPARISAGEMVILNPYGGGIGLFTTVRLVNSASNFALNKIFYSYSCLDSAGAYIKRSLGDIMRLTKNGYGMGDKGERNFTLLGDPALSLAYPKIRVTTLNINSNLVGNLPDTLKAFAKVTIQGAVTDLAGNIVPDFNGTVFPTVFDKPQTQTTLSNDGIVSPPYPFTTQNNVLFRGKVSVTGGLFTFSFIVPKDITYQNGYGRISYYANNRAIDAAGNYQNIIVGGTSPSVQNDVVGPEVKLFLNDEKFVNGGLTNDKPLFLAKLYDESGINIVGAGIGRNMQLTLTSDKSVTNLNDYYITQTNTYQQGEVSYKMSNLPIGPNSLTLKVYDVYNNSSEAKLDFVVSSSEEFALKHVLNYPNPFTTNTTFHFDHNKAGESLKVMIQVFSVSGKLIKTLTAESDFAPGHFDQINWDGRDDYGDPIGKGVYVYKVKVSSRSGKTAEEFQKLVILN